jgi:subtilisin
MATEQYTKMPEDQATPLEEVPRRFLITPRRGIQAQSAGLTPMRATDMSSVVETLKTMGVEIVEVRKSRQALATLTAVSGEATDTYIVRMNAEHAKILKQAAPPSLIIEEDLPLRYGRALERMPVPPPRVGTLKPTVGFAPQVITVKVVGERDAPLEGAKVTLQGDGFPVEGQTDAGGNVTLNLFTLGGPLKFLFVEPLKDYWNYYLTSPTLTGRNVNLIHLRSLSSTVNGFPQNFRCGWGQRIMGLEQVPDDVNGQGVKIAIIDSGVDATHTLLTHIRNGVDLTDNATRADTTWETDVVGHGTHCAGIIAARGTARIPFRGFAPQAEIHALKIFPGGRFSSLLSALDYCIEKNIDIVNLSLGASQPSEAVEQKLEEAFLNGVACVVAAGNSGGAVQYPASSPKVLAVSALGRIGEFPSDSWDAQTLLPGLIAVDGTFSPAFTCFGPEIGVTAPGVAIISTVPNNGFDPQSGTSMAAPHITGLAALILAHHPLFKSGPHAVRGAQRITTLFNVIKSICVPLSFPRERGGTGIPLLRNLGIQTAAGSHLPQPVAAAQVAAAQASPHLGNLLSFQAAQPWLLPFQGGPAGFVQPAGFALSPPFLNMGFRC